MSESEILSTPDKLKVIKDRIFTVDQMDQMMKTDFMDKIAGYSSFSVNHVLQGITPDGIQALTHLNPDGKQHFFQAGLAMDVFEKLFPGVRYAFENTQESLLSNREYGNSWERAEFLQRQFKRYSLESSLRDDAFSQITEFLSLAGFRRSRSVGLGAESEEDTEFDRFLEMLDKPKGVQVLFGDKRQFIEYIQGQNHEEIDWDAVEIYSPIPNNLIIGIVPLDKKAEDALIAK